MKTKTFTLLVTILMMGAVMGAAGQPERGKRDGNPENKSRNEIKSSGNNASQGVQDAQKSRNAGEDRRRISVSRNSENSRGDAYDSRTSTESKGGNTVMQGTPDNRDGHKGNQGTGNNQKSNPENRKNNGNQERYNDNHKGSDNHNGYTGNRNDRDYPNPARHGNYRNEWDNRNYSRNEWEHRNYNWNDHRWNYSSYYRKGHIPWYFRNNRNYWYYPEYGHILRGFSYDPYILYSGTVPFYFEDGFFYRYYPGIGYVWIEDPHGIWFNELPDRAVRVRIGRHIYFRFGNAYFMAGRLGFRLVVLPDRYYDPYRGKGVSFEISARF